MPSHSLSNNALLTRKAALPRSWFLQDKPLRRLAKHLIERFSVKASGPSAAARSLSGGNLQKYVVGREIDAAPRVLVVAQPTWGVDVGAAAQIRAEILKLRDAGSAVLLVSEELDELVELSDTLRVMAAGRISPPIATRRSEPLADRRMDERTLARKFRARLARRRVLIKLEPRAEPSRWLAIFSPLLALGVTVALGVLLFVLLGKDALSCLQMFFVEPIKNGRAIAELSIKVTPLLLIGLGLSLCFRSNVWNIGAEGQFILGSIFATWVALRATPESGPGLVIALLLAGALGGALWASITAVLRDRCNASEILVSLMLVYVAEQLLGVSGQRALERPERLQFPADHHVLGRARAFRG